MQDADRMFLPQRTYKLRPTWATEITVSIGFQSEVWRWLRLFLWCLCSFRFLSDFPKVCFIFIRKKMVLGLGFKL